MDETERGVPTDSVENAQAGPQSSPPVRPTVVIVGPQEPNLTEALKNVDIEQVILPKALEELPKLTDEPVPEGTYCDKKSESENPIHQNADGKWYFWDEIWVNEAGPYDTREICAEALGIYARELEVEHQQRLLHPHHMKRVKTHPHKRSVSKEDRKALVVGQNAWWQKDAVHV